MALQIRLAEKLSLLSNSAYESLDCHFLSIFEFTLCVGEPPCLYRWFFRAGLGDAYRKGFCSGEL